MSVRYTHVVLLKYPEHLRCTHELLAAWIKFVHDFIEYHDIKYAMMVDVHPAGIWCDVPDLGFKCRSGTSRGCATKGWSQI